MASLLGVLILLDTWQDSSGEVMSSSQRPLQTQGNTRHKHKDKHSCPERDSNPRSNQRSGQDLRLRARPKGPANLQYFTGKNIAQNALSGEQQRKVSAVQYRSPQHQRQSKYLLCERKQTQNFETPFCSRSTHIVLTFPRVLSTQSFRSTLVAWPCCPSHYWPAAAVESAYCGSHCSPIVAIRDISTDTVRYKTDARQTSSSCLHESKGFDILHQSPLKVVLFLTSQIRLLIKISCAYILLYSKIFKVFSLISRNTCIGLLKWLLKLCKCCAYPTKCTSI
jgi:hypothetical protein